ncbi:TIR domain-containing protein [Streptomyces phaeochromogenes]|uniref:TIR domain-containing protein n=1 Tax=Streptomyces phaeochromogenes TaxID=1923 RepID=UPI0037165777
MDYSIDVFVSYSRRAGWARQWIDNHFYPNLKKCLEDEIGSTSVVFIDKQMKEKVGMPWPDLLAERLGESRLMIPVLSPPYFESEWCVAEWHTMEKREKEEETPGLIYPIVFSDGKKFPESVQGRQLCKKFKKYNNPHLSFKETEPYNHFYREVKRLARRVSERIENVPPWREDWPVLKPEAEKPNIARIPRYGV